MNSLRKVDREVYEAILSETKRQDENIELIASENFASLAVLEAQGSVLTNKYAEGYPKARWYGGCRYVDDVEILAIERAKKLFKAEHVNVQPHSGAQANMTAYFALLNPGDKVMAMDLACGGHLTHGHPHNFSGRFYKIIPYGLNRKTEVLDYEQLMEMAKTHKPKMIVAGASAYPRTIDFKKLRIICDKVGAYLFVDMAHFAGLVATGLHPNPVPYAEVITTTTHKTLRGPRGGMILCQKAFAKKIDKQVFPGIQGGPLMHVIAAKAVALKEALKPSFKTYQRQVINNARALSRALAKRKYRIVSGGTDTHLLLVDLTNKGLTGKKAAAALDKAHITVNKNLIPFDSLSPAVTSGLRLGTPAATTRGLKEPQMEYIAEMMDKVLSNIDNGKLIYKIRKQVKQLTKKYPLYESLEKKLIRDG